MLAVGIDFKVHIAILFVVEGNEPAITTEPTPRRNSVGNYFKQFNYYDLINRAEALKANQ